ncbi:olfactomedin-4-like [Denticeps clupeoides]|uniref:Olfactomedin-like domain-containing protein n=1 Tax=Denticeps clupeoides TaxID=299321 RepID=A0AAY4BHS5_9TELE|nr:olfactomedin-4-like [Denticeps clupeoides]
MLLFLLLITSTGSALCQRVRGLQRNDSCECTVNASMWSFPAIQFENVSQIVRDCGDSLQKLQAQIADTNSRLPHMLAVVENVTQRLRPFQYLNANGLYKALHLKELSAQLEELEDTIGLVHNDSPTAESQSLSREISKAKVEVGKMYKDNVFNLETVRENLRSLNNRVQSCRTISSGFRNSCSQRIMTNISSPVVTKISPYGKSYISGSWGREAKQGSEDRYWVQPLVSGNRHGNVMRFYGSLDDFMASRNHNDENVAPSYSHANGIQGPGTAVYGDAVYYQCYNAGELCRYDLKTKATLRRQLPDAGFNNQFPYCYYSCRDWTDIDFSADERGLWVIYATTRNHGNVALSLLDAETLNITHTWKTRLFKKAVSNAFMVCGVLYATRYADTYNEEVFYAFDTTTGHEDNSLSLSLEKVAAGVASLQYNPIDRNLYMYNDGYLLAFKVSF